MLVKRGSLVLIAVVASLAAVLALANRPKASAVEEPKRRTFEFVYQATVEVPPQTERLDVWLPFPRDDEHQSVEMMNLIAPFPTEIHSEGEFGNDVLYMGIDTPEADTVEISMQVRVERLEARRDDLASRAPAGEEPQEDPSVALWLEPDRLVPLDARIVSLSQSVTEGNQTAMGKAQAIYDYVVDGMTYSKEGTGWGQGDIYWACDAKTGNCTDFHALFTGLSRAAGIPAKFVIGFPIPALRGEGQVAGYHCWSEFYVDGYGWVPVDASEASKNPEMRDYYFGSHDENRVEFTEGRDLLLTPRQQGEPLNYFVYPYAEADGQAVAGVGHEFSYRDLGVSGDAG